MERTAPLTERGNMKMRIRVEGAVPTAALDDTEVARDFATLLPLSLTLEDYASTEKISDLPRKLSTDDAPAGTDASIGDISYYAPWGNLALFYRSSDYATGLVKLGEIDAGIEAFSAAAPLSATFELMEE